MPFRFQTNFIVSLALAGNSITFPSNLKIRTHEHSIHNKVYFLFISLEISCIQLDSNMFKIQIFDNGMDSQYYEAIRKWKLLRQLQSKYFGASHDSFSMTKPNFDQEIHYNVIFDTETDIFRRGSLPNPSSKGEHQIQSLSERIQTSRPLLCAVWIGNHPTPLILEDTSVSTNPSTRHPRHRSQSFF
jgi:hypothetical protein